MHSLFNSPIKLSLRDSYFITGLPESWQAPVEMLIEHCKDLVRCTMKLLKDEVRDVTSVLGKY